MKFAAIALMTVAMFSADAEAKRGGKSSHGIGGITAKCKFYEDDPENALRGGFFLRQRA